MATLKILHVFGRMDRGGAEVRTLELFRRLRKTHGSAIQFDFCVLSGETGELDQLIRELGGNIYYLPLRWGFGARFKLLLVQGRYSCVHSHVQLFSGYLLRIANQAKVSSRVGHIHTTGGYGSGQFRRFVQNIFMKRWLLQHATKIIAVSRGALDVFLQEVPQFCRDSRVKLIYDAIDSEMLLPQKTPEQIRRSLDLDDSSLLIVHVGRLDPVKNHPRLLKIFKQIHLQCSNSNLVLIGQAPLGPLEKLKDQARELKIDSQVQFLGTKDNVVDYLAAADIMIFPSLWEGLPGAVLEAAAIGLPVLATDLPGCLELKEHFERIFTCSLQEKDEVWARAAFACHDSSKERKKAELNVPPSSPFHVDFALGQLVPIWKGLP